MTGLNCLAAELAKELKESTARSAKFQVDVHLLSREMTGLKHQLSLPVPHHHRHHVPKLVWMSAGLFLVLAMVIMGWFSCWQRLADYRSSDTKLRYLWLQHDRTVLRWVHVADSLELAGPDRLRDTVKKEEAARERRWQLLKQARQKEAEAMELRSRAK
ncbi:hypothetical protein [Chitinophaga sp. 22620]|uniref:hypothetical protein n=1 Tax=Chitinophaga sp. 22620 TaxID=3453952 RepID=UPI003F878DDB